MKNIPIEIVNDYELENFFRLEGKVKVKNAKVYLRPITITELEEQD